MSSFASFSQFIRHGGQASIILSLLPVEPSLELKQSSPDQASVDAFEQRLRDLAAENWSGMTAAFARAGIEADPIAEDIEAEIARARAALSEQASVILATSDPSVANADISTLAEWLVRRFLTEINERRQRQLGVTHYIWRSVDDPKVRTAHAERDDRLFSWDDRFSDGHPGHGYNCRCSAEPAILDGAILLTEVTRSEGLSNRIADAQGAGLADAPAEAAAGGVETLYSTIRFSWLGYRRLFGVITPEEEAERLAAREAALFDPVYRRGFFEVAIPIEDALGRDMMTAVEGVIRIGPRIGPNPLAAMNFDDGLVIAQFRVAGDGEPRLITMFPVGRRE